jgi:hypothetical protein
MYVVTVKCFYVRFAMKVKVEKVFVDVMEAVILVEQT